MQREIFSFNLNHKFICLVMLITLLSACSSSKKSIKTEQVTVEYDLLYDMPKEKLSFNHDVLPVLEKRCIACHGCYDAACQLKLTSVQGVLRGSNKNKVYNSTRITASEPTRLFVDAMTTAQWRDKNFSAVLYEKTASEANNPVKNLEQSVLYQILRLKQLNPQARTGMVSDKFDLSLDREQSCPTLNEFEDYANEHPKAGMPYAMPNMSQQEYKTLVHWIAQGSPVEKDLPPSEPAKKQIEKWEAFFNGKLNNFETSKKEKLVSRYLFEHLFHAHLHFEKTDDREFYRLVRSSTPPGEAVKIIATRRPYGKSDSEVYYRIVRHQGSVVAKQHIVYEFNAQRMKRFKELFYEVNYEVTVLPSYAPEVASNPVKAFADIPVKSRHKFLLDEARFFIEGFIKGPVCRGQVALNVIEDQFWVVFFDPDVQMASNSDEFLKSNADKLASPSEQEDTLNVFSVNSHYKKLFREYVRESEKKVLTTQASELSDAMKYIWSGNSLSKNTPAVNKNAALTVFRHLDSASVSYGLVGDYPETAWLLDYPTLERIHYLLVAGFDVYGNVGHQINTRLFMDFLRTQGEDSFLAFLPVDARKKLRESWYQGIRKSNKDDTGNVQWINKGLVTGYKTDNPQQELYRSIIKHLGEVAGDGDFINRCDNSECVRALDKNILRADSAMKKATQMDGTIVQFLPDLTFVRIQMGQEPESDRAYTMIYNKAYKSVSGMLESENIAAGRDYQFDTQTIVPWLEGSYPNFFYVVKLDDIESFVEQYNAISNHREYEGFVARYGIRRTNEDFWLHADWFNQQYLREQPVKAGIFDLSRYQNR